MAEERAPETLQVEETTTQWVRPNTDTNMVFQLLAGLVGTLVVWYGTVVFKGTKLDYLWAIIHARGPIQAVEVFMAWMIATFLFFKTRIVRKQLQGMAQAPVGRDVDLTDDVQVQELRKAVVANPVFSQSVMLNRLERILTLWLACKDVGRVSSWADAEGNRSTSASDSSYSVARTLMWAIPIMGFIGTVQGLGQAVGGFAGFLKGAAELRQIKEAISQVTVGLGVAFDTTLLALVLSTFLMFPLSAIQRREEDMFLEIDNYLDDNVTSRFPSAESKPIVIENLEDSIEAAFRRYIPDPDRYDEVFTRSIEKAASTVEERFGALVKNYEASVRDLGNRLASSLTGVGESLETSLRQVVNDVRAQEGELMENRKKIAAEEAQRFRGLLEDLHGSAAAIAAEYQKRVDALEAATRELGEKSQGAAQELIARMQDVVKLAAGIEDLLRIEQAIEKSLAGLASSDEFFTTLRDLRRHLETTDAFCTRLGRPRIITLEER